MTNPCNRIKRNRGSAVEFGFVRDRLLASGVALVVVLVSVPAQPDDAVRFTDVTAASHIAFVHRNSAAGNKYLIETMTGGVALLDFDADGWLDVFLVNGAALRAPHTDRDRLDKSAPEFWNRLFRNNRDGTFTDVTERAGVAGRDYGMGAAVGDYDNDGFPDLYVTNYGDSILYHNNGDGTFTDVTARAGVKTEGWTTSAGFFDFDNDGDLDLFVCRYLRWSFANHVRCSAGDGVASYCHPDRFEPVSNYLFRNNGDGTFTDASRSSGIAASPGKGLGVAFADFDGDGRIDVSVANDSYPQSLFRNNGDGTFREVAFESGVAYTDEGKTFSGMGTDFADVDGDGLPDIITTTLSMESYAFFRNNGDGAFTYATHVSGLGPLTRLLAGWGVRVFDYDNDGARDMFFANSHVMDTIGLTQPHLSYRQRPLLVRWSEGRFRDVSASSGEIFGTARASRGAAFGDLDNDGDIDIVVSNCNGPAYVARNDGGNRNHWIALQLRGRRSNRDGIGARIKLTSASGKVSHGLVTTAGSYLSASDRRVLFGLGSENAAREIEILWPSGARQVIPRPAPDRFLRVEEPDG